MDCVLALIYQFWKNQYPIVNQMNKKLLKSLESVIKDIEKQDFSNSQTKFLKILEKEKIIDLPIGSYHSIKKILDELFKDASSTHKIFIDKTYLCPNKSCTISRSISQKIEEVILDWDFNDDRDKSDGFIDNFFNRYTIQTNKQGCCECNETKKDISVSILSIFKSKSLLKNLPNLVFISLESIAQRQFSLLQNQIAAQEPLKNQISKNHSREI